ncbi:TetR/AcrR family transcriptional regulator [Frankia sp. CNm7]|uniref:TetR/AcrR family transcriptional regulator n=1 Tax=Frankia nepalensis TaxID=1836974 RepID=A0A937RL84_9ACTN|nr:TetR/AcrR family transcriptional regulator [Frankia nepalensis]MBL7501420.1 TetR/AcrR family transcriptional regulator [Frankia nepalensis]MBL7510017.1 TetR/AcrR family transcriptional regulator [Frankia nepalensis]MBL7517131.1 TetR/AcrR family transcriptional regulator [Frankia nepalensis]MBL7627971.1 TetR/AcrR family transcriptional regulator [Frankia nepalensis]
MEPIRERAADAQPRQVRRAPWSGRSPAAQAESAREKIIDATVTCIRRHGLERTSISAIATIAGVSRPTVYAYFETREALVSLALEQAGRSIAERVVAAARRRSKTAGDFAVEALIAARREFRAEPALHPISQAPADAWAANQALSENSLEIARSILEPITSYDPSLESRLDEITETLIRWLLSLLIFDSDRTSSDTKLRAYLRRSVVPAILPPEPTDAPERPVPADQAP